MWLAVFLSCCSARRNATHTPLSLLWSVDYLGPETNKHCHRVQQLFTLRSMRTILLIILVLLLIGAFPTWPYSTDWGYYPAGGIGLILLIVLILALMGRI